MPRGASIKDHFLPHEGNNYHPHLLHTKRAIFYSLVFVGIKALMVGFVLLLPLPVFVLPEVLSQEQGRLMELTNQLRNEHNVPLLVEQGKLNTSADYKATDMAEKSYFSHVNPEKQGLAYFLGRAGYTNYKVAGENLAMGFSTADSLFQAWVKSPTHYANLIDPDYQQIGFGMESGEYEHIPTVYVAQHFATPRVAQKTIETPKTAPITAVTTAVTPPESASSAAVPVTPTQTVSLAVAVPTSSEEVLAAKESPALGIVSEHSFATWTDHTDGVIVHVSAEIEGEVESAKVIVHGTEISLAPTTANTYVGSALLGITSDELFKVVLAPSIQVQAKNGDTLQSTIAWREVKMVSPDPVSRYIMAERNLGFFTNIFSVARYIYIFAAIFFAIGIIVTIVVEWKKQHPHIIVQTLGLVAIAVSLALF